MTFIPTHDILYEVDFVQEVNEYQRRVERIILLEKLHHNDNGTWGIVKKIADFGVPTEKERYKVIQSAMIMKDILNKYYESNGDIDMGHIITEFTVDWMFRRTPIKVLEECSRKGSRVSFERLFVLCVEEMIPDLKNTLDYSRKDHKSFLICNKRETTESENILIGNIIDNLQTHPSLWLYCGFESSDKIHIILTPEVKHLLDRLQPITESETLPIDEEYDVDPLLLEQQTEEEKPIHFKDGLTDEEIPEELMI